MANDFEYIVSSRNGLFLVTHSRWRLLKPGVFFGLTLSDTAVYCYEEVQPPGALFHHGRVVRFDFRQGELTHPDIVADGLGSGCHQMDFFKDSLYVVDTHNQRILEMSEDGRHLAAHYPLPPAGYGEWQAGYAHINSIVGVGDSLFLMLHNGLKRPSEVLEINLAFEERRRIPLDGYGCHDIVPLEDGRMLMCNSKAGSLVFDTGTLVRVDDYMTRGLSVCEDEIAVGSSLFGPRCNRQHLPGFVTFLDRTLELKARLVLPAAPAQIRRLYGKDLSFSRPSRFRTCSERAIWQRSEETYGDVRIGDEGDSAHSVGCGFPPVPLCEAASTR
jgi:hypothetical protein